MSIHLERARLLLAQSRPADAEREAMQALAEQPTHPYALALLALSRIQLKKTRAALEAAREAVSQAPDVAYFHYVLASVYQQADNPEAATTAAQEALRLDPNDADHHALSASIQLGRRNWTAALEAAQAALALDPEHVTAINLRSMALVQLGRKAEAMEAVDLALHREPENALSHATQGWNCLHRNDPRRAQEHFREALRLDPELEYARDGMLESLKARNPIYRGMLAYFLWMSRMGARFQWLFIIGVLFGGRMLNQLATTTPQLKFVWWGILGLFYAFIYLSWTAQPMFNLFLRLDRFGRHVLTDEQRTASTWFGAFFAAALAAVVWFVVDQGDQAFFAMFQAAGLSICVAATFSQRGRARLILGLASAGLLAIAGLSQYTLATNPEAAAPGFTTLFVGGFLAFQLLANALASRR